MLNVLYHNELWQVRLSLSNYKKMLAIHPQAEILIHRWRKVFGFKPYQEFRIVRYQDLKITSMILEDEIC